MSSFFFFKALKTQLLLQTLGSFLHSLKGEVPVSEAKTQMEPRQSMSRTQDLPLETDSSKSVHDLIPFFPPSHFAWTQFWKLPDVLAVWGQKQTND